MPLQALQDYGTAVAARRILLYGIISVGAVLGVIVNALRKHSNFYSVAVYLSKSNGTVVVLGNFAILLALLCGRVLQNIFFGPLRAMEVERLYDRTWFFVTESLLAFTIFRDEFDIPFALMFGLLLFTKCFHWLLADRIEWMDQRPYPGPPLLFHIRTNFLLILLWFTDGLAFLLIIESMLAHGVGGTVLFASEYAILLASVLNSIAKYCIAIIDLRRASVRGGENAPPWEDKSMWIFYVELATDFLKLITYLTFFMLVLTFYGLPLNIIRDVYITARSFILRFRDLIRYRTATRNMDERYPNATEDELNSMTDRTCIICREEMAFGAAASLSAEGGHADETQQPPSAVPREGPNTTPKKLPCGHIFHFHCLRSWLERQQSCPTCRRSVLNTEDATDASGRPAQPQPGVVPQAPNMFGGAQQPPMQAEQQGNPGGFFGRLMGAAGMPPIVPGQFAPGPGQAMGFPPPPPNQNGPGPVWDNQVHVQGQRAPADPSQYQYTRNPPAPERFQGFWTPGGIWHPWQYAPDNAQGNGQIPDVPRVPSDGNPSEPTTVSADENEGGTEAYTNELHRSEPDSSHEDVRASLDASSSLSAVRESAADAALRRLATLNSRGVQAQSSERASDRITSHSPESSAQMQPPMSGTPPTESTERPAPALTAPALIPLYDPSTSQPGYRIFPTPFGLRPNLNNRPNFQAFNRPNRTGGASPQPPEFRAGSSSSQPHFGRTSDVSPHSRAPNMSSFPRRRRDLPPTLTDEQLEVLDRLTREAIDERLRILEDVQMTTTRCITELLRCRSALPRPDNVPPQGVHGQSSNTQNNLPRSSPDTVVSTDLSSSAESDSEVASIQDRSNE